MIFGESNSAELCVSIVSVLSDRSFSQMARLPPNIATVAWSGLAGLILIPWAVWIDRHRGETA